MPSSYSTRCPECQQVAPVPDHYLGRNWRCPACRSPFQVDRVLYGGNLVALDALPGGRPSGVPAAPEEAAAAAPAPPPPPVPEGTRREVVALAGVLIALGGLALPHVPIDVGALSVRTAPAWLLAAAVAALIGAWRGRPSLIGSLVQAVAAAVTLGLVTRRAVVLREELTADLGLVAVGGLLLLVAGVSAFFRRALRRE